MHTISVRRANELGDAARGSVESLLGRKVADEEHVTVMAYPAQPAEGALDRTAGNQVHLKQPESRFACPGMRRSYYAVRRSFSIASCKSILIYV